MFRMVARLRRMALAMPRRSPLTEGDARALHGYVGAGAHGNADFSFAQCGRVVDAVAGHCNVPTLRAKLLDMSYFSCGLDLRFHRIKAQLPGHRGGGAAGCRP